MASRQGTLPGARGATLLPQSGLKSLDFESAASITDLGEALSKIGTQEAINFKRTGDAIALQTILGNAQLKFLEEYNTDRANTPPAESANLLKTTLNKWDTDMRTQSDKAAANGDYQLGQAITQAYTQHKVQHILPQVFKDTTTMSAAYNRDQCLANVDKESSMAQIHPGNYDYYKEKVDEHIESLKGVLATQEIIKVKSNGYQSLATAEILGQMRANPYTSMKILKDGTYTGVIGSAKYSSLLAINDKAIRRLEKQKGQRNVRDQVAAQLEGIKITNDTIAGILNDEITDVDVATVIEGGKISVSQGVGLQQIYDINQSINEARGTGTVSENLLAGKFTEKQLEDKIKVKSQGKKWSDVKDLMEPFQIPFPNINKAMENDIVRGSPEKLMEVGRVVQDLKKTNSIALKGLSDQAMAMSRMMVSYTDAGQSVTVAHGNVHKVVHGALAAERKKAFDENNQLGGRPISDWSEELASKMGVGEPTAFFGLWRTSDQLLDAQNRAETYKARTKDFFALTGVEDISKDLAFASMTSAGLGTSYVTSDRGNIMPVTPESIYGVDARVGMLNRWTADMDDLRIYSQRLKDPKYPIGGTPTMQEGYKESSPVMKGTTIYTVNRAPHLLLPDENGELVDKELHLQSHPGSDDDHTFLVYYFLDKEQRVTTLLKNPETGMPVVWRYDAPVEQQRLERRDEGLEAELEGVKQLK